jgi:hypothetical protein
MERSQGPYQDAPSRAPLRQSSRPRCNEWAAERLCHFQTPSKNEAPALGLDGARAPGEGIRNALTTPFLAAFLLLAT